MTKHLPDLTSFKKFKTSKETTSRKILLVTAFVENGTSALALLKQSQILGQFLSSDTLIIVADGGLDVAMNLGLNPHIVVGDMDSSKMPKSVLESLSTIKLPVEKDFSDTEAILMALLGYIDSDIGSDIPTVSSQVLILGGLGGRLDHSLANLGILQRYNHVVSDQGSIVEVIGLLDGNNFVQWLEPGVHTVNKDLCPPFNSIGFAALEEVKGVTLTGLKYSTENATLMPLSSFAISNSFLDCDGKITIAEKGLFAIRTL